MEWWFALAGVFFGVIGGMGMGGGIILIPVLTLFLGVGQHAAQGLNLLAFLPMSIFALIAHIKNKRVEYKTAILIALFGLAAALFGAWLAEQIEGGTLKVIFGIFLILLGVVRAIQLIKSIRKQKLEKMNQK